jgi:Tfp pilus assembly protein PilF
MNQRIVRLTSDMDFHQGYQSLDDNSLTKLSAIYERAVGEGNNEVTTLFELGAMYLELEDYDRAQGILGCALKQDSSFTGAWLRLSDSFKKQGSAKVAISILERAKDLADDKGRIFARLARLHFDTGDRESSRRYAALAEKHGVGIDPELKDQLK